MIEQKSGLMKYCLLTVIILLIIRGFFMAVIPLTDPSESRYANICANMALTGNFVEPKLIHRGEMTTFSGKPPLYFQMGGIACNIFGKNEFAVRFPAMLCGIIILLILYGTVKRLAGKDTALRAFLLCATTPFFFVFCGISLTDMTLCLSVFGALCAYMLFSSTDIETNRYGKKGWSTAFFFFLGLGMLAKGPVALVLAGMPIFLFVLIRKRWRELREHAWFAGIIVFLAVAVPWYWIMQVRTPDILIQQTGQHISFLNYFFVHENFLRFVTHNYGDQFGAGREFFRGVAFLWFLAANALAILLTLPLWKTKKTELKSFCLEFPAKCKDVFRLKKTPVDPNAEFTKSNFSSGDAILMIPLLATISITIFWCLTSRVPVYYILPTVPPASIAAVILLDRAGSFDCATFCQRFNRFCLAAGILTLCGLLLESKIAQATTKKMPKDAYRFVLDLQKNHPDCKDAKVYILRTAGPYSAEFYLGKDNFVWHNVEDPWLSLKKAKEQNCILMLTVFDIQAPLEGYDPRKPLPPHLNGRDLAKDFGIWKVYLPEKTEKKKAQTPAE